MPIDTSSYYPEINDPNDKEPGTSLNANRNSIFDPVSKIEPQLSSQGEAPTDKEPEKTKDPTDFITLGSNIISWILVPLIMPVYATIFIFKLSVLDVVSHGLQTTFTFIMAGINVLIPVLLIFLLKFLGLVQDVGLNGQKERSIPYIITAICLVGSAWFMYSKGAPVWVAMFFTGGAVAAVINMAINFKWKISAHAAAIAGVIALLIRLEKDIAVEPELFIWLLITVGAAGLLGSARIWMKRHTVWQVLAGYLVGFCSVFFIMSIR